MLMFCLYLNAESSKNISATYKITFGIAGQVGTVQTSGTVGPNHEIENHIC